MLTILASLGVAHVVFDGLTLIYLTKNIVRTSNKIVLNAKKMARKEDEMHEGEAKKEKSFKDYRKY